MPNSSAYVTRVYITDTRSKKSLRQHTLCHRNSDEPVQRIQLQAQAGAPMQTLSHSAGGLEDAEVVATGQETMQFNACFYSKLACLTLL